jgi:toxin ParE1/3/4
VTPARLRPLAEADLVERTRYYLLNAGEKIATEFLDAAIAALEVVERMPGTGSPRIGELCDIPAGSPDRQVPLRLVLLRPPQ